MNSKPLVSIIVPVYNVEKYLDKCLDSVVNQTYTNLEIILVDDGSPDNCPAMCNAWKSRDPRINVIHQKNGGLSVARNGGMKLATGEFIGFVDTDDWIERNMVECLLSALLETDADIATCCFQQEREGSKDNKENRKSLERRLLSSDEALKQLFLGKRFIQNVVWNKLYRRTVISDLWFPAGKLYEDGLWTAKALGNARLIVTIDYPLYHYLYRPESLSHDARQKRKRFEDEYEMIQQRIDYIRESKPSLEKLAFLKLQDFCCREYLDISINYSNLDPDGAIRRDLRQQFHRHRPVITLASDNIGRNIGRILFWISPDLLLKMMTFCKKGSQHQ